jgi:hypothetical protein
MKSNTRFKDNKRGYECLNCKQPLGSSDNFCSNCGQVNDLKPLSIKQYLKEFLSGFFAFDTRTLNTLIPLLFRPGKVALEYVNGERMRYVNPFQLYFHTSIVFFLVLNLMLTFDNYDTIVEDYKTKKEHSFKDLKTEKTKEKVELQVGVIQFTASTRNVDSTELIVTNKDVINEITHKVDTVLKGTIIAVLNNNALDETQKVQAVDSVFSKNLAKITLNDTIKLTFQVHKLAFDSLAVRLNHLPDLKRKLLTKSKQDMLDADKLSFLDKIKMSRKIKTKDVARALDSMGLPITRTNIYWFQKAKAIAALKNEKSGFDIGLTAKFISKISLTMFFMLPLFTVFVWLFYYKRRMTYTEHLIFVFNAQTVAFIIVLLLVFLQRIITSEYVVFSGVVFPIFLYIALYNFYKQSYWLTLFKFTLVTLTYFLFLSLSFVLASLLAIFN